MDLASVQLCEYIKIIKYIVQLRITELITLVQSQDKIYTAYSKTWKTWTQARIKNMRFGRVAGIPYYEKIIIIMIFDNNY